MDNFDLKKYLAEGRLLKEAVIWNWDGDRNSLEQVPPKFKLAVKAEFEGELSDKEFEEAFDGVKNSYADEAGRGSMKFNSDHWAEMIEMDYLEKGRLSEGLIKFIDYVNVDQDKLKTQYDKHYDDYGDDEDFVEEFGRDFLSPNIKAINQYYGAKVSADDVIEDFFSAGGINNISSKEEFEAWLDKNREFYI